MRSAGQQKSLTVGDQCPNILIKHIINYGSSQVSIDDFKDKLLIIDFWATWCAPCVSMIPVTESLQNEFKEQLAVLLVTTQDSSTVTNFFRNMKRANHAIPGSATGDTVLSSLFNHVEIPHYVWIGKNRKVLAITGGEQLTKKNIQSIIDGESLHLAIKKDEEKIIDEQKAFFTIGNEIQIGNEFQFQKLEESSSLYHSVITKSIAGFGSEDGSFENKLESKNSSIGGLYRFAAGEGQLSNMFLNSTIWEVTNSAIKPFTDSTGLLMDKNLQTAFWMKDHTFCYELVFPEALAEQKFDIMLRDLNNYFGALYDIEGRLELRKTKCLVLVRNGAGVSSGTTGKNPNSFSDAYHLKLTNQPVAMLINYLGIYLDLLPPLVDETKYTENIDIELNCNLSNINSLNESLEKYGLQLKEKIMEHNMIVIKNKSSSK